MTGRDMRISLLVRIAELQDCRIAGRIHLPSYNPAILQFCNLSEGFPEENLAQVVLQKEGIRDTQSGEEPDDVAVEQGRLPPARRGIGAVPQVDLVDDDVFRVAGLTRLCRAEEGEQGAVGSQDARQLTGQRLRGTAIEVIDHVPAQDPVDRAVLLRKAFLEEYRQLVDLAPAHVTIQIREDVLDEDLASELLAEKTDVAADHRAEIEQNRRFARRERGQELPE